MLLDLQKVGEARGMKTQARASGQQELGRKARMGHLERRQAALLCPNLVREDMGSRGSWKSGGQDSHFP